MRQQLLRPHDVAVALELALRPGEAFVPLAQAVGLSQREAHGAVTRLTQARLLSTEGRRVLPAALLEFAVAGVPHAFPATIGPETRGVPTAAAAAPLAQEFPNAARYVWPTADGPDRGQGLAPLYPKAPMASQRRPDLHALLALVDAIRIGQARERKRARELLHERLRPSVGK